LSDKIDKSLFQEVLLRLCGQNKASFYGGKQSISGRFVKKGYGTLSLIPWNDKTSDIDSKA